MPHLHLSATFPPTPRAPWAPGPLLTPLTTATTGTAVTTATAVTAVRASAPPKVPAIPSPPALPTPLQCEVPHFTPVRVGGLGPIRWHGAARRRLLTLALATTAAALATGLSQDPARTASAPTGCPAAATSGGR
ncbi:hypothetical protein GCM10009864_65960 [Streptomyces lunalinharesii]|uniref:Uncharacterized protein n=1 Tax=Streptomyces lunalinharesii TaxID=333384 RepID=A0ABN3SSL5_9ACTN